MHTGTVRIADFQFLVCAEGGYLPGDQYAPFVRPAASGPHTFTITVTGPNRRHAGTSPRRLFDCSDTWQVFEADGGLVIVSDGRTLTLDRAASAATLSVDAAGEGRDTLVRLLFPFDEILTAILLTRHPGIIAHACGVIDRGRGAVFVGASGSGKSTMARLWLEEPGSVLLNDDRIVLRRTAGGYHAYGTPWHGEVPVCGQGKTPLERLFFIDHAERNHVRPLSPADAAARLMVRSFPVAWDRAAMDAALGFTARLVADVPCYELGFRPDKTCVGFLRDIMHPAA